MNGMPNIQYNKRKIINDPIYGFVSIPNELIFDLIEHPFFQRLRRIKQLGLTHLVYPGALHTRFQHSLGTMHLMQHALSTLKSKGHTIKKEEEMGALIAILLHDIGHGPFSHALENSLVPNMTHEEISNIYMRRLNDELRGDLSVGIDIFNMGYPKPFLSQLVASQLDMDRLDYLKRDSFFTGVSEGVTGTERIIKMLEIHEDNLVAEYKGIYSIEKFIVSRRIMYWQVYLHKTVLSAETMLVKILQRAGYLCRQGVKLFTTPPLKYFLSRDLTKDDFSQNPEILEMYSQLDDFDIFTSLKNWNTHEDIVLSTLCKNLINRRLFRCQIQTEPFEYFLIEDLKEKILNKYPISEKDLDYFIISDTTSNFTYNLNAGNINILSKTGRIKDIIEASDQLNIQELSQPVTKHFICYPKSVEK